MAGYRNVAPAAPAAGYIGGKKRLARQIVARIEAIEHGLYGEPFVGMGGVFLRRRQAPKVEVINDASRDIATFFRVLQRHYQAFLDALKWQLTSRSEFDRLITIDPETLTDLDRAARFLYLQRVAFGGRVLRRSFGVRTTEAARFDTTRLGPVLEAIHARLAGVTIECLDWRAFFELWDRPQALFFVDPPYCGSEHEYGHGLFSHADHEALAGVLRRLKGRFILTMNDTPETRAIYGRGCKVEAAEVTYSIAGADRQSAAREIIVTREGGAAGRSRGAAI